MPRSSKSRRETTVRCFVIMSFQSELNVVYEKIYKTACKRLKVTCERMDTIFTHIEMEIKRLYNLPECE